MNVGQLTQHLAGLARLFEASGSRPVAAELTAVCDSLAPFGDRTLKEFAALVSRLERKDPEAQEPARPRPAVKPPAADVGPLASEVQHAYENASSPSTTAESVEALIQRLAPLTKDNHVKVAERIGLAGMQAKNKPQIQAAIRDRILKRKGVIIRSSMTDRL